MINCFINAVCIGRDDQECANYAKRSKRDDGRTCQSHGEGEHSCNITPTKHQDAVNVNFKMVDNVNFKMEDNGEYVLQIKMINLSSADEDEIQRGKHMAQNGAMLLLYGKMLQDMGEKLIAQSQASIYSIFNMPTPPKLIHV
ncbi:hypothetical protein Fmac_012242 [Flemingia macrophylla]|uniref:Uncharacterized protein n=1 Tax=Flemingia macrophylla TaxID=520843 RepID=A0ABD1MPR8_9FABA